MASTLDGYIADAANSSQWLLDSPHAAAGDPDADAAALTRWDDFIAGVGVMAMGATTYEWLLDREGLLANPDRWHEFYGDRPCWIFTHRELPRIADADFRFVRDDVGPVHADMLAAAGAQNVWLVGGGELVGQFHDAGLLEEILVSVAPVTLGAGAPLLPRRIEGMRLTAVSRDGQRVNLTYDVHPS